MIHILIGNNIKSKSKYIDDISKGFETLSFLNTKVDKSSILEYISGNSLFQYKYSLLLDNIFSSFDISFSIGELKEMQDSVNNFIFLEDKMLASEISKYKKYANIEKFEYKELEKKEKINVFDIASSFGRKDKIQSWVLYNKAIENGIEPEAIAGILFWKIKNMIISKDKMFNKDDLMSISGKLVSLYHESHLGKYDMSIALEQFILQYTQKEKA